MPIKLASPIPLRHETRELASGTATQRTVIPEVVPNENVVDVIVVLAVMPDPVMVNVADWSRKGLCGLILAIQLFALL
jgi:hypothetical protein